MPNRVVQTLLSRRIAVLLIAALGVWAVIGSSLPGGAKSFSSPPFLIAALWLAASTAVCAWQRSLSALRWRRRLSVRRPIASSLGLDEIESRLRRMGLVAARKGETLTAHRRGNVLSRWASPVFHWALSAGIALVVIEMLLSASTGLVLISGVAHQLELKGTKAKLTLADVRPDLMVGGVSRGQAPRVTISRPDGSSRTDWSYPNNPLGFGGVVVHAVDSGPAVRLRVRGADGSAVTTDLALRPGVKDQEFTGVLRVVGGPQIDVARRPGRRIEVVTRGVGESPKSQGVIAEGESARLAAGTTLTFLGARTWASVRVVRDPVAWLVAVMSLIACAAAGIALLYPAREVEVTKAENGNTIRIASSRMDPAFACRVIDETERAEKSG